jgi:molybdenum cofactor synthesis domain-containing protein
MPTVTASTACALLIGNELLNGMTADCNLAVLARTLHSLGIRLARAVVLPDLVEVLAHEIREASRQFDVVFTSGGVGPTHDDVTIAAVAQAFQVDTVVDEGLRALLGKHYPKLLSEAQLRLALVPRGACTVAVPDSAWPTLVMHNVWVLPGVPSIFERKLEAVRRHLQGPVRFHSCTVMCRSDELTLKGLIDRTVLMHPQVQIGSYPLWVPGEAQTKITFESVDARTLQAAVDQFVLGLSAGDMLQSESQGS